MEKTLTLLNSLNISYRRFDHPPVFTCGESGRIKLDTTGAHTKNLFLKTEKTPHQYFLYSLPCESKAELKSLAQSLNLLVSSRLTFASPAELKQYLGLTPGSVSPFGLINDKQNLITYLMASSLVPSAYLLFHPNDNSATLEISWPEFQKFLSATHHTFRIVN